ncbi:MAG: hypothetical protein RQ722_07510 [Desulfuromonadales bacterium]|nr:hypothetical protein [Desulfuromonadales bacterium]
MRRLMALIDPGCVTICRSLSDSLERKLSLRERWQLRLHLLVIKQLAAVADEGARNDDPHAPPSALTPGSASAKRYPPESES